MINVMGHSISPWIVAPIALAVWLVAGWTFKKILFVWLQRLTSRTQTQLDDIVIGAANAPLSIMIVVWGVAAVMRFAVLDLDARYTTLITTASKIATILALILFVDQALSRSLRSYSKKIDLLRVSEGLSIAILHLLVLSLGALVLMDSLGISITPIIASLGIGSLAVALALQPTLENIFSGFQIMVDRPVVPGQFVKLESGEKGYVDRIGWRSTWIRQLSGNMVIIPNKQLINSRVTNFYYPALQQAVLVNMGVHYKADLGAVERVCSEVAETVMKTVQGGVPDFKPFIRFNNFNASSIDFTVIMQCREFTDNYLIKHEFIKAIAARFGKEGIVIPYPITAINTEQEKAFIPTPN